MTTTSSRAASRLLAGLVGTAASVVTGIVVARTLGVAGKGIVSTLSFLVTLAVPVAGLGLGEAGVMMVHRRGESLQRATSATLAAVAPASVLVGAGVALAGWALYHDAWSDTRVAVAFAAAVVPASLTAALANLFEARQPRVVTIAVRSLAGVMTAALTALLLVVADGDADGALVAVLAGWCAGAVLLLATFRRARVTLTPRRDRAYLRSALRIGIPVQVGAALVVASTRLDLVSVQVIAGDRAAGLYSVAATIGTIVAYAPAALTGAQLAAVAATGDPRQLLARTARMAALLALLTGVALAITVPVLVPLAFGQAFRDAVVLSELAIVAGVLGSVQHAVTRLEAATGTGAPMARSYVVAVAVMLAGDLVLVPAFGAVGAAWASIAAAGTGFAVAIRGRLTVADLLPRRADVERLLRWHVSR